MDILSRGISPHRLGTDAITDAHVQMYPFLLSYTGAYLAPYACSLAGILNSCRSLKSRRIGRVATSCSFTRMPPLEALKWTHNGLSVTVPSSRL
ncbi:hypothetical protein BD310DRAFT_578495 [Dichomitus squalens]|uniref:Uncharacterized protein n=1 Tax=Dichomitus squalens TaxID=114155 RepID=A0A4Q9Q8N4_9APHY|nr:hypothetical protein BD310DRAFT_578495 [Dichomitus squalens]